MNSTLVGFTTAFAKFVKILIKWYWWQHGEKWMQCFCVKQQLLKHKSFFTLGNTNGLIIYVTMCQWINAEFAKSQNFVFGLIVIFPEDNQSWLSHANIISRILSACIVYNFLSALPPVLMPADSHRNVFPLMDSLSLPGRVSPSAFLGFNYINELQPVVLIAVHPVRLNLHLLSPPQCH